MRNSRIAVSFLAFCLVASAGFSQSITNPEKGGPSPDSVTRGGNIAIPDDAYDGTIGTMACDTTTSGGGAVEGVTVDLAMNHTWVGDLVVKVQSPAGTVTTLQSRGGYSEPADDGTGCCGDSSDMAETSPWIYQNTGVTSAEDMGATIAGGDVVCAADGFCDYFPFPDMGPGVDLDDFIGEDAAGDWLVCVGDSAGGDTGDIDPDGTAVNLTIAAPSALEIPTLGGIGVMALLSMLALGGVSLLRRRKQ